MTAALAIPAFLDRRTAVPEPAATIPAADRQVATDDNANPPPPVAGGELDLQQPEGTAPNDPSRMNVGRLPQFVTRIEKLEEERKAIGGDIKDVYSEAKGVGYDVKTIRKLVALRRMDAADRAEQETLLDVYKHALGMV